MEKERPSLDEIIGAYHQDLSRYVNGASQKGAGAERVAGFAELKRGRSDPVDYPMSPNVVLASGEPPSGTEQALVQATAKHAYRDAIAAERLRSEAHLDELTGINNRRSIDRLIADAVKGSEPGVVIMYDLDRFKEVNDVLGHAAGDRLLQEVATKLDERVRPQDHVDYVPGSGDVYNGHVGRRGGDEFLVVLHGVDTGIGYRRAAEINDELNETLAPYGAGSSFGWAMFGPESDPHEVRELADSRMYADKNAKDASR